MATDSLSSTFTGRVVSVNDKGLKLEGHESWLNVSKFAVGVVLPARGAVVSVICDPQGFIRSCTNADGSAIAAGAGSNGNGHHPAAAAPASARERTITRLAVLKAAAEFAATRAALKSGDVLKIAESWERWIDRDDDPIADLIEAF